MSVTDPHFNAFEQSEIAGAIAVNVFAVLSTSALSSVAFRVLYLALWRLVHRNDDQSTPREYVFFHTQLGRYAACLLLANIFNGAAGLMGIPWLLNKGITEGRVCTAQAIIMQIGNASTAYFTVTIAVHTFNTLVLRKRQSAIICGSVVALGWISASMIAASPLLRTRPSGPLYGSSGLSCGVRAAYPKAQFFFHLLPIFIASVLSAILYSLIFLVLRGTLVIKGGLKLKLDPQERWSGRMGSMEEYRRFIAAVARSMLWYPIAYIALLVPYSVTRLLSVSGFEVPFAVVVFAFTCWFMLGLVNVLLLYNTFRVLGPAFDARSPPSTRKDMESFSTSEHFSRMTSPMGSSPQLLDEKIMGYRFPLSLSKSPSLGSIPNSSRTSSVRHLVPTHHAHHPSDTSMYSTSSSIDRAISPIADLNREIVVTPQTVAQPYSSGGLLFPPSQHLRQGSADSQSLPAPPRPSRSPISRRPTFESPPPPRPANIGWIKVGLHSPGPTTPVSRAPSAQSAVSVNQRNILHQSSSSTLSEELDTSAWLARQRPDGSMPHGMSPLKSSRPLISAVASQTSFPSPTFSYSRGSAASPTSASSPRSRTATPGHDGAEYFAGDSTRDIPRMLQSRGGLAGTMIGPPPIGRQRAIPRELSMSAFNANAPMRDRPPVRQLSSDAHSSGPTQHYI